MADPYVVESRSMLSAAILVAAEVVRHTPPEQAPPVAASMRESVAMTGAGGPAGSQSHPGKLRSSPVVSVLPLARVASRAEIAAGIRRYGTLMRRIMFVRRRALSCRNVGLTAPSEATQNVNSLRRVATTRAVEPSASV